MTNRKKFILLASLMVLLIVVYLFWGLEGNISYILTRRATRMLAIVVTGIVVAVATLIFQTITNNRILTPSLIGLDSLYQLVQTFIIFFYGSTSITVVNQNLNFVLSVVLMIVFALVLFHILFKRDHNVYLILLTGLIFGTFFESLTTFMQVLIDPNEFLMIQNRMFASFNNVQTELLYLALGLLIVTFIYLIRFYKYLDVIALGKDTAVNLGLEYDTIVQRLMVVVAILISIATALVGPITFLGILVVNVTYEMFKTYRHSILLPATIMISVIALVGGQLVVDRIFSFSTPLSVIINLIGGSYFLYLILKENRTW